MDEPSYDLSPYRGNPVDYLGPTVSVSHHRPHGDNGQAASAIDMPGTAVGVTLSRAQRDAIRARLSEHMPRRCCRTYPGVEHEHGCRFGEG